VLERGLAVAEQAGVEAYLLRCAAPLGAAAGSPSVLARADRLLEQATMPVDGAWLLGEESYLCLAQAWLEQGDAERAPCSPVAAAHGGRPGAMDGDASCDASPGRACCPPARCRRSGQDPIAEG
jgi:hypothetical protein